MCIGSIKCNKGLQGGSRRQQPRQRRQGKGEDLTAGVEVSGPAPKECTADAVLELKHMIHICYQQRIDNSDLSQSQHIQSSLPHPFMVGFCSHQFTAEIQEVNCAEEKTWQLLLLRPLNSTPSSTTVTNLPSLSHHCQKAAIFIHISVHSLFVALNE